MADSLNESGKGLSAKYLSTDEVADALGFSLQTTRQLMRAGRLPAVRLGRQFRVKEQDLNAFLADGFSFK